MEEIDQDPRARMPYVQPSYPPPPSHMPLQDNRHYSLPPASHQPPKYQPPPSPYDPAAPEHRSYTEPPPRTPVSAHPGYGPPRDAGQYPPEAAYSRPGSISAPTRSPSETHQMQHRPSNGHDYPSHHTSIDYGRGRPSYPPQEIPPNGAMTHGMPGPDMSDIHGPQGMPPTPYGAPPPGPAGPIPGPYDAYYQSSVLPYPGGKRRPVRAAQACDNCRARKAKCDEGRPTCSHCRENNQTCVYREVPPPKQEKANAQILEKLEQMDGHMQDSLSHMQDSLSQQAQMLDAHVRKLDQLAQQMEDYRPQLERLKANDSPMVAQNPAPVTLPPQGQSYANATVAHHLQMPVSDLVARSQRELEEKDRIIEELSMPIGHTTAAHKLLDWDAIKALLPAKTDPNYVMKGEEDRGLIRIYGRGEGSDKDDGGAGHTGSPHSSEGSRADEQVGSPQAAPSPTPSEGPWGTGYTGVANVDARQAFSSEPNSNWGGLNSDGTMDFHQKTVKKLHVDYMNNIHILHPFLDRRVLTKMVNRFISKYSPVAGTLNKSAKRKRSLDGMPAPMQDILSNNHIAEPTSGNRALPERTISNAIVLLVLALGKICQWKDPLPGPTPSSPPADVHKVQTRSVTPSAMQMDSPPNSSIQSPATSTLPSPNVVAPSPTGGVRMTISRSYSAQQNTSERREPEKNIEVIPGMAYYAYATDILGNTQGGNDIPHVQAALLAGLYMGQLAHSFTSHGWITQACRSCQVLIRPANLATETNDARRDLIFFAFWTCLQLESDILAELDLPASGISRYESYEKVNLPRGVSLDILPEIKHVDTLNMVYYSAQVQVRKTLNRVHTELYKDKTDQKGPPFGLVTTLNEELEDWRKQLPFPLSWKDSDSPASTINAARLRAKYYGAKYIIHRPLLYYALHSSVPITSTPVGTTSRPSESPSVRSGQYSLQGSPSNEQHNPTVPFGRRQSEMGPPRLQGVSLETLDPKLREASEICIQAAINSTTALDGVDGRLIVTNIFGTAHAQFGNLLVLAATYNSHLGKLVEKERLQKLLDRTIEFLSQSSAISPTLKKDTEILTDVRNKLFSSSSATRSFSSVEM